MNNPNDLRDSVRTAYDYRCGYCGVPESLAGGELELDHFQPRQHGGTDSLANLVYACPACNRFKSDYWHAPDAPESMRLLHPQHDELSRHIAPVANGRLIGLTPRGWFHLRWLHLNRPQLIALRLRLREVEILREAVMQSETIREALQQQIRRLEVEIAELRDVIARLTGE